MCGATGREVRIVVGVDGSPDHGLTLRVVGTELLLELQVRSVYDGELPIEPDVGRWFPIWGAPVP